MSDHGYGWRGLCVDDTSGSARMTIRDLSSALSAAAEKMDLIFFDACYMQSIEVAYELRNSGADYIVGSQAPSSPVMPFDKILAELARNPDQSLLDFARNINDRYAEKYQAGDYFTQSTVELAKIAAVVDAHAAFVQAIVSNAGFAAQQAQAARVSARIADAVVYNRTGGAAAGYTGLGIYFPEPLPVPPTLTLASPGELDFYIKWTVAFSTESGWKRFLDVYTSPGGPPPFPLDRRIGEARQALDGTVGDELAVVDLRQFCDLVWQRK